MPGDYNQRELADFDPENLERYYNTQSTRNCTYYDVEDFNMLTINSNPHELSVISLNIRSIHANMEDFMSDFMSSGAKLDILSLVESRLSDDVQELYKLPNYDMFTNNRNTRGGGNCIYVSQKYNAFEMSDFKILTSYLECLFVSFKLANKTYVMGSVYRPPGSDYAQFMFQLEQTVQNIISTNRSAIMYIMGDFNVDLLAHSSHQSAQFVSLMYSLGLTSLTLRPTRVATTSATLLDHIWTSDLTGLSCTGIILSNITDNFPVFCQVSSHPEIDNGGAFMKRSRKRSNWELVQSMLADIDWNDIKSSNNLYEAFNNFSQNVERVFSSSSTVETKIVKKLDVTKPYVTFEIKTLLKEKHKIQRLCI